MAKTNTFKKLSTPQKLFRSLDNVRALNILGEAGIKALPVSELTKVGLRGVFHCVGLCYQSVTKLKYEYSSKENGDIDDILSLQQGLGGGGHLGLLVMNTLDGTKSLSPQTKTFRFLDNTIRTIGFGIPNLVEVWRFCPNFNYDKKNNITLESSLNVMASLSNLAMLMSPLYTQAARPYLPHIAAITLGLSTAAKWIKDGSEENTDNNNTGNRNNQGEKLTMSSEKAKDLILNFMEDRLEELKLRDNFKNMPDNDIKLELMAYVQRFFDSIKDKIDVQLPPKSEIFKLAIQILKDNEGDNQDDNQKIIRCLEELKKEGEKKQNNISDID